MVSDLVRSWCNNSFIGRCKIVRSWCFSSNARGDLDIPTPESESPRERVAKFLKISRSRRTFSRAYPPPCYNLLPSSFASMAPHSFSGSEEEILKRAQQLRRKRGGAATSSTDATPLLGVDSGVETPTKKTKSDDVVVVDPPHVPVPRVPTSQKPSFPGIPSDFLSHHGVDHGIMPTASQILFSSARRRLDPYDTEVLVARTVGHLLQGLQNELVVAERLRSLTDAQVKANLRLSELQATISKAEEEKKAELQKLEEKLTRKAEEQEKELVQQAEELRKEHAEEQRLKQEAVEECKDVEAKVIMFVRA